MARPTRRTPAAAGTEPGQGRSWAGGLLVLALHLAAAWGLSYATRTPVAGQAPAARALSLVWLRLKPEPEPALPPRPPARRPLPLRADAAPPIAPTPASVAPQPITLPPATSAVADGARLTEVIAAPTPPASAPLDLWLRPGASLSRQPAGLTRSDAALRPHDTAGLGALATDQRLTEQVMQAGRRIRQGDGCVEVRPSRATQIDPFAASGRLTPQQLSPC